jgi:hypothetical protein
MMGEFEVEPARKDSWYCKRIVSEVFSIRFVNHEKLDTNSIYGTIMVDMGSVRFILYNRKVGDPSYIDSEVSISVTLALIVLFSYVVMSR